MKKFHFPFIFCLLILFSCQNKSKENQEIVTDMTNISGSVNLDGSTLNYYIKGKGLPFVVIGSDPEYFSKDLQNSFRFYFIETRLNAKNYEPVDTLKYDFDNLLKDIDTLRSVLGLEKFIIGGHSVMGAIAHQYAKENPEYVSGVILIATPRTFGTPTYTDAVKVYWESASEERKKVYEERQRQLKAVKNNHLNPRETFIKTLVASGPKRWHDANFDATAHFDRVHYNLDFLNHLFGNVITKYDLCSPAEKLNIPVFAAIGKSDYIGPYTLWYKECQQLSNLTIFLFERSGHTPQFEQSTLFNERLVDWAKKELVLEKEAE